MTPTADDLLPCPFCGGEADIRYNWAATVGVFCQKCGGQSCYFATEALAIAAWNTRAAPRWIPVTERLPEKVDDYLVKIADNLHQNRSIKILPYFHSRGWMGESKQCPVTHWMPLPEPPKEVE